MAKQVSQNEVTDMDSFMLWLGFLRFRWFLQSLRCLFKMCARSPVSELQCEHSCGDRQLITGHALGTQPRYCWEGLLPDLSSLLESCLGNGSTWLLGNGKFVYLSGQSGECDCDAENAPSDPTDVYLVSSTRTSFKSDPCYIK